MPTPLQYQNPSSANVNAVLDGETIDQDSTTGTNVDVIREYVVAQESQVQEDPLSRLCGLMEEVLGELKKIRVLLEIDVMPGAPEGVIDESEIASGVEEEGFGSEGIEEQ